MQVTIKTKLGKEECEFLEATGVAIAGLRGKLRNDSILAYKSKHARN